MDTTLNTLKALQGQQSRNDALTETKLDAACAEGTAAAKIAVTKSESLFLMDEVTLDRRANAYAVGWNAELAKARTNP